ncbi:MAG: LamG-like jellyroll fold domain-containing protein, partial [Planctomycetota bacterium]
GDAISIRASESLPEGRWVQIGLTYDGSSRADGLGLFVDGSPVEVDVIRDRLTKSITGGGPGAMTIGQRFRDRGFKGGSVDHLQVFDRALTPIEWRALHGGSTLGQPDASDRDAWYAYHRATRNPARDAMQETLRGHRRELAALLDRTPEIMVMEDFEPPREARVLERGRYDRPLHVVEPGVPASLGGFPDALPRNRLGLARWLVPRGFRCPG